MNIPASLTSKQEESCVDDVRRIREKISRETGSDINRLIEHINRNAKKIA